MAEMNFPSNSHRYNEASKKEERKKLQPVVTGTVKKASEIGFRKVLSSFIEGDLTSVRDYIIFDWLVPGVKDAIVNAISLWLNGEKRNSAKGANRTYVSYSNYYNHNREKPSSSRPGSSYTVDNMVFERRDEAEEVLNQLVELIDTYHEVKVADLFELCNIDTTPNDFKYGWTELGKGTVNKVSGGYELVLPKAKLLEG